MAYINSAVDAIVKGDEAALSHLLTRGLEIGTDLINTIDENGMTLLMHASASAESELLVPFLLEKGADMNIKDYVNRIALHYHAAQGRVFGLTCLLYQSNALIDQQCGDHDSTPLDYAIKFTHQDTIKLLVAFGAKVPSWHLRRR